MKKLIFSFLFILAITSPGAAQEFDYSFGIKGGINYSLGGYLEEAVPEPERWDAQSKIGFHGGAFVQANLGRIFFRPELVYTSIQTEYELPNGTPTHSYNKIDLPLLIGYNVYGPLDIYAGPVYSNLIDKSTLEGAIIDSDEPGEEQPAKPVVQEVPGIHLNMGAKLEFGRFGIDLRYEHNLTALGNLTPQYFTFDQANESQYGVGEVNFTDPRINQIILSVTFKIFGSDIGGGNQRLRGGCY